MKHDITKAIQFSNKFRYIDDLLSINNVDFGNYISTIYPSELQLPGLPHHLLKCVISTHISRQAVQTHLSVSASMIREMTLHSGLSFFLKWTATFPPIQLRVFIYLNWWDMLEFALPKLTSWIDSADFPYVSDNKVLWRIYFSEHLINFNRHGLIVVKYGATLREMRFAIQPWIAPSYPYITYLLLRLFFQLYLNTRARTILFCARALFINLIDVCI